MLQFSSISELSGSELARESAPTLSLERPWRGTMDSEERRKQKAEIERRYYRKNAEKIRRKDRIRHNSDPERHKRYRERHPLGNMLTGARRRAKRDGVPFSITEKDLYPLPKYCPILEIELDYNRTKLGNNSPSLDKIIPSLGYVLGNVCIISNRANQKKSDFTLKELEKLILYMKKFDCSF